MVTEKTTANPSEQDDTCTECGGDATIGAKNWVDMDGKILVGKDELICMRCFKKRTGMSIF